MGFRPHGPEPCASTSSTTSAGKADHIIGWDWFLCPAEYMPGAAGLSIPFEYQVVIQTVGADFAKIHQEGAEGRWTRPGANLSGRQTAGFCGHKEKKGGSL